MKLTWKQARTLIMRSGWGKASARRAEAFLRSLSNPGGEVLLRSGAKVTRNYKGQLIAYGYDANEADLRSDIRRAFTEPPSEAP